MEEKELDFWREEKQRLEEELDKVPYRIKATKEYLNVCKEKIKEEEKTLYSSPWTDCRGGFD